MNPSHAIYAARGGTVDKLPICVIWMISAYPINFRSSDARQLHYLVCDFLPTPIKYKQGFGNETVINSDPLTRKEIVVLFFVCIGPF